MVIKTLERVSKNYYYIIRGEITEILKLSKPHFDGNKFVYTSPYAVEEEELLLWSLTSLQGPLRDEGYQR